MSESPGLRERLREMLLERSLRRGDFVLASGRRSSFYIDARQTTMSGEGLALIGALGFERLGASVVIVEDVITTGRSAQEAIRVVEGEGGRVLGVLAVVDRDEGGRATVELAGYQVDALLTARDLGIG